MSVKPLSPPMAFLIGELTMVALLEVVPRLVVALVTGKWQRAL